MGMLPVDFTVHEGVIRDYPPIEQVRAWLGLAGFDLIDEEEGDGYWHLLARVNR